MGCRSRLQETNGSLVDREGALEHAAGSARFHDAHRHAPNERADQPSICTDVHSPEPPTRHGLNHLETGLPAQRTLVHDQLIADDVNEHYVWLGIVRDPNLEQQPLPFLELPRNDHNRMV